MAQSDENGTDLSNEDIIINERDGLPNVHPNLENCETTVDSSPDHSDNEYDDLPTSLIVTNINDKVFVNEDLKREMEQLFRQFDSGVSFQWLKSFRRLRVNFQTAATAAGARLQLHQYHVSDSIITCYFAQPVTPVKISTLQLPAPVKQFLISPPASPPLDWQPRPENEPIVNHDLLAAIATLAPGGSHELHAPAPGQPGIVVHAAAFEGTEQAAKPPPIAHTRCPDY